MTSTWTTETEQPEKNSGLNEIRTDDPVYTGAALYPAEPCIKPEYFLYRIHIHIRN